MNESEIFTLTLPVDNMMIVRLGDVLYVPNLHRDPTNMNPV